MIGKINIGPYNGAVPMTATTRGTATSAGSYSADQIGGSLMRRTIDFGSLADGEYDLESAYPPGSWALCIVNGVARIFDDWGQADALNEVRKIPRSSAELAAGPYRMTNQESEVMDITLGEVP